MTGRTLYELGMVPHETRAMTRKFNDIPPIAHYLKRHNHRITPFPCIKHEWNYNYSWSYQWKPDWLDLGLTNYMNPTPCL
jgi:hypothetical protein